MYSDGTPEEHREMIKDIFEEYGDTKCVTLEEYIDEILLWRMGLEKPGQIGYLFKGSPYSVKVARERPYVRVTAKGVCDGDLTTEEKVKLTDLSCPTRCFSYDFNLIAPVPTEVYDAMLRGDEDEEVKGWLDGHKDWRSAFASMSFLEKELRMKCCTSSLLASLPETSKESTPLTEYHQTCLFESDSSSSSTSLPEEGNKPATSSSSAPDLAESSTSTRTVGRLRRISTLFRSCSIA